MADKEDSGKVKVRLLSDIPWFAKTGDIVETEGYTAALWIRSGTAEAYEEPKMATRPRIIDEEGSDA